MKKWCSQWVKTCTQQELFFTTDLLTVLSQSQRIPRSLSLTCYGLAPRHCLRIVIMPSLRAWLECILSYHYFSTPGYEGKHCETCVSCDERCEMEKACALCSEPYKKGDPAVCLKCKVDREVILVNSTKGRIDSASIWWTLAQQRGGP